MYDVIIIGSGPAGLAAAIYAKRAALETLVLEKTPLSGGQIINTYEVDNYPGLPGISGMELGQKMRGHVAADDAEVKTATVTAIEDKQDHKVVHTNQGDFETRTVVLAMGASHRQLGVPGEEDLCGMGVSYCATCDGAFFKNRDVAVVGGGDVARDCFRGGKVLQQQVQAKENIVCLMDSVVDQILGQDMVEKLHISNTKTKEATDLPVQGIFIAVGIKPNTDTIQGLPKRDEAGYILAAEDGVTDIPGIFVAGDCRTKQLRQVITAAADGANAITSVEHYLSETH